MLTGAAALPWITPVPPPWQWTSRDSLLVGFGSRVCLVRHCFEHSERSRFAVSACQVATNGASLHHWNIGDCSSPRVGVSWVTSWYVTLKAPSRCTDEREYVDQRVALTFDCARTWYTNQILGRSENMAPGEFWTSGDWLNAHPDNAFRCFGGHQPLNPPQPSLVTAFRPGWALAARKTLSRFRPMRHSCARSRAARQSLSGGHRLET